MRAWFAVPGPEGAVFELRETPVAAPGPGQVAVAVRAAGTNRGELIRGAALKAGSAPATPARAGTEFAGEIAAVGDGVSAWQPGDRVMGRAVGSYAKSVVAHQRALMKIPAGMSWAEAAAIPNVFVTAHDALVTNAAVRPGEAVMVTAGPSGVGTAAIQIARHIGANPVIATTRTPAKADAPHEALHAAPLHGAPLHGAASDEAGLSNDGPLSADDELPYPGTCREKIGTARDYNSPAGVSWRFKVPDGERTSFDDGYFGWQEFVAGCDFSDFLLWRRDDIPAYQLAVVVDDAAMQITEVVRGADLLKSTARQLLLIHALGYSVPSYFHCPLLRDEKNVRLAKRHDALSLRKLREQGVKAEELRKRFAEEVE